MKTSEQRINNIIGQLEGVKGLLAQKPQDCLKILTQLKAIKAATASLMEKVLGAEMDCYLKAGSMHKEKARQILAEIIKK